MTHKHKPVRTGRTGGSGGSGGSGGPSFVVILTVVTMAAGVLLLVVMGVPSAFFNASSPAPPNPGATARSKASPPASPAAAPAPSTAPAVARSRAGRSPRPPAPPTPDPLFDFAAITSEPLDAVVLNSATAEGLVTEEFEYTSFVRDGKPDRVRGILVYPQTVSTQPADAASTPQGAPNKLPGVFWSQSGMYAANTYFPALFARKGCFSANITLPHPRRNSGAAFDTADPRHANLTLLAIDQMRAITYMTQRPEVDPDRIVIAGSSYGGFFATLLAAVDPRVSGGMSFFGAGHQQAGTNLPQFTNMKSRVDLEIWNRLIDPGVRLKQRAVPFLFTCPSNDNWFFPPSVVETFRDAPGDCRLAIVPQWMHGFPENIDQQIVDFADVLLDQGRAPYNKPGELNVEPRDGKLVARWSWTGDNAVKRAELVVSYGPVHDWHYWNYRHHQIFSASIDGQSARAELPVPFSGAVAYVYGNIIDERDVVTSTIPLTVDTAKLPVTSFARDLKINTAANYGHFEPAGVDFLVRQGEQCGIGDKQHKHGGEQSIRIDPLPANKAEAHSIRFRTDWVPGQAHRMSVWVRSAAPVKLQVRVEGAVHRQWNSPLVMSLVQKQRGEAKEPKLVQTPAHAQAVDADEQWKQVTIDVPPPAPDIEGWGVRIIGDAQVRAPFWIDDLSFEPVWSAGK